MQGGGQKDGDNMAFIKTHVPCPYCGSKDNTAIDDGGYAKCFGVGCGKRTPLDIYEAAMAAEGIESPAEQKPTPKPSFASVEHLLVTGDFKGCQERGILPATAKRYHCLHTAEKTYYGYYDKSNPVALAAVKMRYPNKSFPWVGDPKSALLFGQQLFPPGSGRAVTITEGEEDAMAGFQLAGNKFPVVSIPNGAQGAYQSCKQALEWLNSFESVVIAFDSDEPGQKAAKEVAQLFGGKAKIMHHPHGIKDACDYYKQGRTDEWNRAWFSAEKYSPDGIVSMGSLRQEIKNPTKKAELTYPWHGLNKMLLGIHPHTIVTWAAGSGVGKSSINRELLYHLLTSSNSTIGTAFMEEDAQRTARGLVGLHIGKQIHLPGVEYTHQEVDEAYDALNLDNRMFLWKDGAGANIDGVISRFNYYTKGLDCDVLVLDHLGMVINGLGATINERQLIDEIMTRLRSEVVQKSPVALNLVSHLTRPDGKPLENGGIVTLNLLRGSGSIAQLSDVVIGVERDTQADTEVERNTLTLRVLKNRITGETGIATQLRYERTTGRLTELGEGLL